VHFPQDFFELPRPNSTVERIDVLVKYPPLKRSLESEFHKRTFFMQLMHNLNIIYYNTNLASAPVDILLHAKSRRPSRAFGIGFSRSLRCGPTKHLARSITSHLRTKKNIKNQTENTKKEIYFCSTGEKQGQREGTTFGFGGSGTPQSQRPAPPRSVCRTKCT